jgi:hypothetical protein
MVCLCFWELGGDRSLFSWCRSVSADPFPFPTEARPTLFFGRPATSTWFIPNICRISDSSLLFIFCTPFGFVPTRPELWLTTPRNDIPSLVPPPLQAYIMTDHVFKDWMDTPTDSGGPTTEEAAIIADYVSCRNTIGQGIHRNVG